MATQNYARCDDDNTVVETWRPPENLAYLTPGMIFEPTLAAKFLPCPDNVSQMWVHDPEADTWTAPVEP